MAPAARQLDNRIKVVTPENIAFEYLVAGPFSRLPAYLIVVLIRVGLLVGVSLVLWFGLGMVDLPEMGVGLSLVLWLLLEWFYGGLFETFWNGQTPGKRMMRLRVVTVDGQPINALQAVLPLLPAKQRPLADGDWLKEDSHVICPDPAGNVILRIEAYS